MENKSITLEMNKLLARAGVILTLVISGVWMYRTFNEPVSTYLSYWRLAPFFLGYIWVLWKQIKTAMYPAIRTVGSAPTMFLFMVLLTIGTPIESQEYLMLSMLTLVFVLVIILVERFEDRIKKSIEARKNAH